jgi:CDP-diacylglycerol--serine O-phosphatidyltransferase
MKQKPGRYRRFRRGIYVLPTLFTTGNLLCGFYSLVLAGRGQHELAALLIVVAAVLDGLDGRIARMTGTTSEFGLEFDSLSDVVSFGIAPAFLAYEWALAPFREVGWLVAFLYVVCAAMRLARFNIQKAVADKRYFAGLPSPMAAAFLACAAHAFPEPPATRPASVALACGVTAIATLMVSRLRYRSFKDLDLRDRRSYTLVLPMAVALVLVVTHPKPVLLALTGGYVLSGPAGYSWALARRRLGRVRAREPRLVTEADGPSLR